MSFANAVPPAATIDQEATLVMQAASPEPPPPPPPVLVSDIASNGVLLVISKPNQRMYVFRDGKFWGSSRVSTGRRGKATPSGVFAILQKNRFHRSNIYSNAPMPWMQRLTWSGIAIHAGHVPRYPASHGCIRLPTAFARSLYRLTEFSTTAVIVTSRPIAGKRAALRLASVSDAKVPMRAQFRAERAIRLAQTTATPIQTRAAPMPAPPTNPTGETIQLAAMSSRGEAAAHWAHLLRLRPELAQMQQAIVPAIVNLRRYYRLRATSPDAVAICSNLKRDGIDCFAVS
ncbi:L,D-transpeptidase family protein [Tsuneonella mangrovi]|uniref:L,D-transpeptidase family protein n=1 Tax=Tsuneonella mangrovi TaxID=1982042 RepID=UPI000BA200B1|nr:L,D-transpeptidase family protein [Tsuneonella mangrovi]